MKVSIIIRTYNEARHLPDVLRGIQSQAGSGLSREIIVVDSGSTDGTLDIARTFDCRVEHIRKQEFSFGRSLNIGCAAASGDVLVMISGHCIPADEHWLSRIVQPLADGRAVLVYGCQRGDASSRFSECRIFERFYPAASQVPQRGFFCNNANSALLRSVWERFPFDEDLTGLEDMHLGKRLVGAGLPIGYVADAIVRHLHHESWIGIKNRFEREAIAMQHIMPEVHLSIGDLLRYTLSSILLDLRTAIRRGQLLQYWSEIVAYRIAQYWGSYRGNHDHRELSRQVKERYFYPRNTGATTHLTPRGQK